MTMRLRAAREPTDLLLFTQLCGLACISMSNAVLLPVLGPVGREVGLSEGQIGALFSVAALIAFVSAPLWGQQADQRGQASVYRLAMLGFLASLAITYIALAMGLSSSISVSACFWLLLLGRMFYAGFASGALPAVSHLIATTSTEDKRAAKMAGTGVAFGTGSLLGAGMTALIAVPFGPLAPLACIFMLSLCALPWAKPPKFTVVSPTEIWASAWTVPPPRMRILYLAAFLSFTSLSTLQIIVPYFLQDSQNLTVSETTRLVAGLGFLLSIATLITLWVSSRRNVPPYRALLLGLALVVIATLLISGIRTGIALVGAHLLLGIGSGLIMPALQSAVSLHCAMNGQGRSAGQLSAATTAGYVAGPMIGGLVYAASPTVALVMPTIISGFTLGISIYFWRNEK